MNKVIVQIYEIQTPAEAVEMIKLGVDHIGTVLTSDLDWKRSEIKQTLGEIAHSSAKSCLIPLFNKKDLVIKVIDYYTPDIIHFCDNISNSNDDFEKLIELQMSIKDKFPEIRIMRSIPVVQKNVDCQIDSLEIANQFLPYSDYYLTDTLIFDDKENIDISQPVEGFVGITGKTCDWDIVKTLVKSFEIPVILAGGIGPKNVYEGIQCVHPAGVDSCTNTNAIDHKGVPIRFKKDLNRVRQLIARVREAEHHFYN